MNKINKDWDEFQKVFIPSTASIGQVMDMKTAFFTGMGLYYLATMDILDKAETEKQEDEMFSKLHKDMMNEVKKVAKYHKNRQGNKC